MHRRQKTVWKHVQKQTQRNNGVFSQAEQCQECECMKSKFKTHVHTGEKKATAAKRDSNRMHQHLTLYSKKKRNNTGCVL